MALSSSELPEDADEYLTMTFDDPTPAMKSESLTQKKKRQAREAEIRGRPKSKAELAAEEKSKREAGLSSSTIDPSNKGFKMMAALGYKPGTALGAGKPGQQNGEVDTRLLEPVGVEMKEGRSGIGADAEKKRKFREEVAVKEEDLKKRKVEEGDFRERQQREREQRKMEGQAFGAMKVCERLEEEEECSTRDASKSKKPSRPLHSVNVLWRGLVKQRALQERDKRMRYDLHQSLSRRPTYDDPDEDKDERLLLGKKSDLEEVDLELDQEDEELEQFESLDVAARLQKLVDYLRERWHYCFWCKYQYPEAGMEGCPGTTEEDHD
jgi:Domain of unknown function (DUF4187)/G-patch domain